MTRLRCGYVTVPENRRAPDPRRLRLAFALVAPSGSATSADVPFLFLSGGPGATGLSHEFLRFTAPALAMDRPLMAFDQRGVGYSEPMMCPNRPKEDARISALDLRGAALREHRRAADLVCLTSMVAAGIDLGAYHSAAIADDVEDIRQALGYSQWILLGVSMGGALAQQIMWRHPASVRAAVLLSPDRFDESNWLDIFQAVGDNLRSLAEVCTAGPECPKDLVDLEDQFHSVAVALKDQPLAVAVDSADFGREVFVVNPGDFVDLIAGMTMSPQELPFVPRVLEAFRVGDTALVAAAVSRFLAPSDPRSDSPGMGLLVRCHDLASPETRVRWQRVVEASPMEGELDFYLDSCDLLPVGPGSPTATVSRIPTLILSGRFDDRTPPEYSAVIMETFRNSYQVVFENGAHDIIYGQTWRCFAGIVQTFVRVPGVAPDGRCAREAPPLEPTMQIPVWAKP
jgi:pimeloyl-ACP methyl ester carboxylesterase